MKKKLRKLLPEIRPNQGSQLDENGGCSDTDEVIADGKLHVEQMSEHCFWARVYSSSGKDVVMWFDADKKGNITLSTELE